MQIGHGSDERFLTNFVPAEDDTGRIYQWGIAKRWKFADQAGHARPAMGQGAQTERDGTADAAAGADQPKPNLVGF